MQLGTLDTLVTKEQNKMHKLLTYAETKTVFSWKSTSSIRRYVASGDLVRVHLGRGMNTFRITEESARAFVERLKTRADEVSTSNALKPTLPTCAMPCRKKSCSTLRDNHPAVAHQDSATC
jgi:hypothetical protein